MTTRGELRRIARGADDATAWQAGEWLERVPRGIVAVVLEDLAGELAAGVDDAYAYGVSNGPRAAWSGARWTIRNGGPAYAVGFWFELLSRAVRRRIRRGVPMMLAAALAGALIGVWLSPGRVYAAPADDERRCTGPSSAGD